MTCCLHAQTRALDGEGIATNHDLCRVLHPNQGASMIWSVLEQPTTEDEAVAILIAGFPDIDAEKIENDTAKVFAQLKKSGLITIAP